MTSYVIMPTYERNGIPLDPGPFADELEEILNPRVPLNEIEKAKLREYMKREREEYDEMLRLEQIRHEKRINNFVERADAYFQREYVAVLEKTLSPNVQGYSVDERLMAFKIRMLASNEKLMEFLIEKREFSQQELIDFQETFLKFLEFHWNRAINYSKMMYPTAWENNVLVRPEVGKRRWFGDDDSDQSPPRLGTDKGVVTTTPTTSTQLKRPTTGFLTPDSPSPMRRPGILRDETPLKRPTTEFLTPASTTKTVSLTPDQEKVVQQKAKEMATLEPGQKKQKPLSPGESPLGVDALLSSMDHVEANARAMAFVASVIQDYNDKEIDYTSVDSISCNTCGKKSSVAMQRCKRCKKAHYCGPECQEKDWKIKHAMVCRDISSQ